MEQVSNIELFKIISKQWADSKDICILACCKETKASKIKKEITQQIIKEGKSIYNSRYVPMARVIKYLGIDEKRIIRNAKAEMEILKKDTAATVSND